MDPQQGSLQEVVELHAFFEAWFNGALPRTDDAFARFDAALAPGFLMFTPDGKRLGREEVLSMVRDAHGSTREDGSFRIWIENQETRAIAENVAVQLYEEWQESDGETRGRQSWAVFAANASKPNGVEWSMLVERWLPGA